MQVFTCTACLSPSPCASICAADEIDTIGRARGNSQGADNDEREQGLMQLLVEMDGFDTKQEKV